MFLDVTLKWMFSFRVRIWNCHRIELNVELKFLLKTEVEEAKQIFWIWKMILFLLSVLKIDVL